MKFIIFLYLTWPLAVLAADPAPAPVDPITAALAKLTTDVAVFQSASGSLAVAQTQLATIQAQVNALTQSTSAAAVAVQADQAALAALLPVPQPTPTPVPTGPVVSLVAITDPATCPPCATLQPALDSLKATGQIVTLLKPADPVAVAWKYQTIPTLICAVNGIETARYAGPLSLNSLKDWTGKTKQWADQYWSELHPLPPPPKAER